MGKKFSYTEEQKKARSETVRQSYINHPELRNIRSEQFKRNRKNEKKETTIKRAETFKDRYAKGEIISWNKGKTKETDERIKKYAEKKVGIPKTKETIKKMSETKKRKFASGETISYFKGRKRPELTKRNLENNPSKIPGVAKKIGETRKRLYKEGKLIPSRLGKGYLVSREKNPNWLGGKSFEPYGLDFNKKIRRLVRERDGCCMLCNIGFDDLKLLKRRVHIHHINYDKNCNLIQNFITLCNSCHTKTNYNRPHWTKFFQSLLSERYGYKYTENQEIIIEI